MNFFRCFDFFLLLAKELFFVSLLFPVFFLSLSCDETHLIEEKGDKN